MPGKEKIYTDEVLDTAEMMYDHSNWPWSMVTEVMKEGLSEDGPAFPMIKQDSLEVRITNRRQDEGTSGNRVGGPKSSITSDELEAMRTDRDVGGMGYRAIADKYQRPYSTTRFNLNKEEGV